MSNRRIVTNHLLYDRNCDSRLLVGLFESSEDIYA